VAASGKIVGEALAAPVRNALRSFAGLSQIALVDDVVAGERALVFQPPMRWITSSVTPARR
jgi:hypothetical protein